MNPTEQHQRRTAVATLESGMEALAEATEARIRMVETGVHDLVSAERAARRKLANEQREYIEKCDRLIWTALDGLRRRGFWGRLNWLITGR